MGVLDFVKDAGAAVGVGKSSKEEAADKAKKAKAAAELKAAQKARADASRAAASASKAKQTATARAKKVGDRQKAAKAKEAEMEARKGKQLQQYVVKLGLKVRNLNVVFDDGVARVSGIVANRATKEKVILALGNVEGVSQVRDSLKVTASKASSNTAAARARRKTNGAAQTMHTVVSGDNLSKIAKKYLGDANRYPEIFKANQPMLTNPDLIQVGQVLRIPRK